MYWSLVQTTTAPTTLKPTLKQTRPTAGSIRRQPHIRRRPTYSEVVRNPERQAVSSFIPQRASEEASREQDREQNGEYVTSLMRLEANSPLRRLLGHVGEGMEHGTRHEGRNAGEDDEGPEEGDILTPATLIGPPQWNTSRGSSTSTSGPSGVDISEYFSWMSNPSDSTSPTSTSSVPGVRHSPEPIPLHESGYESPILDEDSASDMEIATLLRFRGPERMTGNEASRRTSMNEDEWTRREHEALERMRRRIRIARHSPPRGLGAEGEEHGEDEEEEYLLQEFRRQYAFWE